MGQQDIASFDDELNGVSVMEVKNPGNGDVLRFDPEDGQREGRPFTIKLLSSDNPKVVDIARKAADRRVMAASRTRQPVLTAVVEKDAIEVCVAATAGWDILIGGKKPPETPEAYRDAYTKYRWLFEQVDQHVGTRANFMKV